MAAASAFAAGPAFDEIGRLVPGFSRAGSGGIAVADFDGDGRQDIATTVGQDGNVVEIIGYDGSGLGPKQILVLPDVPIARVLSHSVAGAVRLVTVSQEGVVREFGGWPLQETHQSSVDVDYGVVTAAIGDIDGDGSDEIVVSDYYSLHACDLDTGAERWNLPLANIASDILLEQLDADPALEIVVATQPGLIVDGATQATDWSYKDGFGSDVSPGHFQNGGGAQFVGATYQGFTVFQSAPYSPVWDSGTFGISTIATSDLDADGYDEIVESDSGWGDIHVYDGRTHGIRLTIPQAAYSTDALATAHFFFGLHPDVVAASENAFLGAPLSIFDAVDGTPLWSVPSTRSGPFAPVAIVDTAAQAASVFFGSYGNYPSAVISQIDAITGDEEWQSPQEGDPGMAYNIGLLQSLHTAARGAQSPMILAAGTDRILAIDSRTHAVLWQTDGSQGQLGDIALLDIDNDGRDEIASCQGSRLHLYSGSDGAELWESVLLGNGSPCPGIMAGRFDAGPSQLLVAVLPTSMRAFDATTHLLAWTLPVQSDGATLLDDGVGGREFVVFSGSTLSFYDGATRTLLRDFDLGVPIRAVHELGDVGHLLVAAGNTLQLVDGVSGDVLASTDYLGENLAAGNQLAASRQPDGRFLIAAGSDAAVFRFMLSFGDPIFANGFEPAP